MRIYNNETTIMAQMMHTLSHNNLIQYSLCHFEGNADATIVGVCLSLLISDWQTNFYKNDHGHIV